MNNSNENFSSPLVSRRRFFCKRATEQFFRNCPLSRFLCVLLALLAMNTAYAHIAPTTGDYGKVLDDFRRSVEKEPLQYTVNKQDKANSVVIRDYTLTSQQWNPDRQIVNQDTAWKHDVRVYIPAQPRLGTALLQITGGSTISGPPSDAHDDSTLCAIATATRTIVISLNCEPNQPLYFADSPSVGRSEDDFLAHTWRLFLDHPAPRRFLPGHLPMMGAAIRTMDLAERELTSWQIHKFIVTGASKRGWATWLTGLADERVIAIAPVVIDMLNLEKVMEHTRNVYGNSWPIAWKDYYNAGITERYADPNFYLLRQVEDPLTYLSTKPERLAIPKLLIDASSDQFFVPDASRFFLKQLPGTTLLDVVPNASHGLTIAQTSQELIHFVNHIQDQQAFPDIRSHLTKTRTGYQMDVTFSERPISLIQWKAINPVARDFRYGCGYPYTPTSLKLNQTISVTVTKPTQGWMAIYLEAVFKSGLILTTPVSVLPEESYPTQAPPPGPNSCLTLPAKQCL